MVMPKEKISWRLEIDPETAHQADEWFDHQGIRRTEAVHRILQWALAQSDEMRLEMLGQIPESMRDRVILEAMADLVSDADVETLRDLLDRASRRAQGRPKRRSNNAG